MTDKLPCVQGDMLAQLDRDVLEKTLGPLKAAVIANDANKIKALIRDGADPNETTLNGVTLLHGAAGWDNAEAIDALIQGGADPDKRNPKDLFTSETPLHYAAYKNMVSATRALIRGGADIHVLAGNEVTPLHVAAHSNNAAVAAVLLEAGANPDARMGVGMTPLHSAAQRSGEIVGILVDAGADPDARDALGKTPLHYVWLANSEAEVVEMLIAAGADANAKDIDGRTPLHSMARDDPESGIPFSAIRALLNGGADPSICDAEGNTPNPSLISSALRSDRDMDACPRRQDYVDAAAFEKALEEFFKGEIQTSHGMTDEAKAQFLSAFGNPFFRTWPGKH